VILTSATRSGGEVRITEAERPRHIHPGRTGCQTESPVHSAAYVQAALCGRRTHGPLQEYGDDLIEPQDQSVLMNRPGIPAVQEPPMISFCTTGRGRTFH
jgi:hypothetical protein